jgi:hypothetical protein
MNPELVATKGIDIVLVHNCTAPHARGTEETIKTNKP